MAISRSKRIFLSSLISGFCLWGAAMLFLQGTDAPAPPVKKPPGVKSPTKTSGEPGDDRAGEEETSPELPAAISEPTAPADLTSEQIQNTVIGHWQSEYYGTRYLTIRPDGTAVIYFRASTLASMVVGSRLRIEYAWRYDPQAQQVIFDVTGGGPASGLDYVMKMWGKQQRQKVITVCEQQLLIQDLDGKTSHDWQHLEEIPDKLRTEYDQL